MTITPAVEPAPAAAPRRVAAPPRLRRLVAATLGSGLIYGLYLALVAFLPYRLDQPDVYLFDVLGRGWGAAALFVAVVSALFGLAALAWQATSDERPALSAAKGRATDGGLAPAGNGAAGSAAQDRRLRRWALAPPILFALALTFAQPLASRDLFHYVMEGRILGAHGANPFLFPPSAFPADPFFRFSNWDDYTSPYGPLWVTLAAGLTLLAGDSLVWSVILFKLVALAGYLACGALIWGVLRRLGRPPLPGTTLWLWNPLVLLEFPGAGHNDVLMLAGMLLGLWLLLGGRPRVALVAVTIGALVKYVALALGPLILWRRLRPLPGWPARAREALRLCLPAGLLFVAALAPFWIGPRTLGPLRESDHYYSSLAHLARLALQWFLDPLVAGRITRGAIVLALAAGYLLALREAGEADGGHDRLLAAAARTMTLLIVLWSFFVPWYSAWAVALTATLDRRRAAGRTLLLTATATLSYLLQLWVPARWPAAVEAVGVRSALSALLIFVPFLLTYLPAVRRGAWGVGHGAE